LSEAVLKLYSDANDQCGVNINGQGGEYEEEICYDDEEQEEDDYEEEDDDEEEEESLELSEFSSSFLFFIFFLIEIAYEILKFSQPRLFVNFDTPKFTTKTPVATAVEQQEMGDEIGKFLQSELQPTLQDIERQLTLRQTVSERTQLLMAKVLEAMTGVQASEIDLWATNILDKKNGEARRREIQCPSLLPVTSVPVPDEVLDLKRCLIDKILQSMQALTLHNF
ncbi:MAG: hypothetical protein EZS28_045074, partial [Streblomastix strix]